MSKTVNNDVSMKMQCFAVNVDLQAELEMPSIRNGSDKALANKDTLLPTQMLPHLPVRATFVVDTNFVSGTQKMFLILFRNILCAQQMFPSLCSMETQHSLCVRRVACPRNIMSNNVSATMCPPLPVPICCKINCLNSSFQLSLNWS